MIENRRDPDKLLAQAQAEEQQEARGKLKIYLGAAPGVGKTYEMLSDSLEERHKGLDVIVGVAESHGRKEIEAKLQDFEILPRQCIQYHGTTLQEFDLDAALKRHPALILVDEMAHTNAPGLRHKKRWQDIKELLDRGIDVATTLNVQHIESLNDDVARIIYAPIRETVPDSMIERADVIELVDLPPEVLLQRLAEGKVYIPEQAQLAQESFFRKGNLIALRELALRITAERVGAQVLLYRQGQGIQRIWPTSEKLLVCVGSGTESTKLIRTAKRMAIGLQADWVVVHVANPRKQLKSIQQTQLTQNLRLAEQLGAEIRVLTSLDITNEIVRLACELNVTQIMVCKPVRARWREILFSSLADNLLRHSGEINVYIMNGALQSAIPTPYKPSKKSAIHWKFYAINLGLIALATAVAVIFKAKLQSANILMIYLISLTISGLLGSWGASLMAGILTILAYDYFFIPPYHSFWITDKSYLFVLFTLLIITHVISRLRLLTRRQSEAAHAIEKQTSTLYALSRELAQARGIDKLLNIGLMRLDQIFEGEWVALLMRHDHLKVRASYHTDMHLDTKELGVAQWVYKLGQPAGLGTDSLSFSEALYLPLLGSHGVLGVLRIKPSDKQCFDNPERKHLLETLTHQLALALEVDILQEQKKRSEFQLEIDQARSNLLRSLTYDFRTPLKTILTSAIEQIDQAKNMDSDTVRKNAQVIYFEAEELNRLIHNLLQITHFELETVNIKKELLSIKDLVQIVVKRSKKKLALHPIRLDFPADLPPVGCDSGLIQEVLINVLDNSIKFTNPETSIEISAKCQKEKIIVMVRDYGPGIEQTEVHHLFDKFFQGKTRHHATRGLGLGLTISKFIIKAHGGEIWAENVTGGGAAFLFSLPLI